MAIYTILIIRPIYRLPSIKKIFEKIVHFQLFQYFTNNKLLYPGQYGFITEYSTEFALNELIDRIYLELDAKKIPIAIFIDLPKAFDPINHSILICKLEHYGIRNIVRMVQKLPK